MPLSSYKANYDNFSVLFSNYDIMNVYFPLLPYWVWPYLPCQKFLFTIVLLTPLPKTVLYIASIWSMAITSLPETLLSIASILSMAMFSLTSIINISLTRNCPLWPNPWKFKINTIAHVHSFSQTIVWLYTFLTGKCPL